MVIPLQKVINGELPDEAIGIITEAISSFICRDKDVEEFLKNKALEFERRDKSRTYLIFSDSSSLLGYFTLSLNALPFRENVSKNTIRRIDGFSKDVQAVGIILIGQFGKDAEKSKNMNGNELLEICLRTIERAKDIIGGRFIMLECLDIDKVVKFYSENGFQYLQLDKRDRYIQMVRRI